MWFFKEKYSYKIKPQTLFRIWDIDLFLLFALVSFHPSQEGHLKVYIFISQFLIETSAFISPRNSEILTLS